MAPLKKLPYAERMQKKENEEIKRRLQVIHEDLSKVYKALLKSETDALDTWRWAALESFRVLQRDFPQSNKDVQYEKARALAIAREAQAAINFTS
jgi:hypothetical protein